MIMVGHGKQRIVMVMVLAISWPVGARAAISVGFDLMAAQGLFSKTASFRVESSLSLTEEFGLRLPLSMDVERVVNGPYYLEGAVYLDYHPLGWPLCISLSLAQMGLFGNHPWEEGVSLFFLNEMAVAWDWMMDCGLYIRPQVVIRDPNRVFEAAYEELSEFFTRFAMVRFSLVVGWSFPVGSSDEVGSE